MTTGGSIGLGGADGRWPMRAVADLGRWVALALAGLLAAAAVLVLARRSAGAMSQPLPPPATLGAGVILAAVAAAIRLLLRRFSTAGRTMHFALTVSTAVLAAALTFPQNAVWVNVALWALLGVEEAWAWRARRERPPLSTDTIPQVDTTPRDVRVDPPPRPHGPTIETIETEPDARVTQQLTRSQAADGSQQLHGWLRTEFAAGQRTTAVHLAFCPPLGRTPTLSVDQRGGPNVRVKTAQLLPHGARLDLKLAETADEPQQVLLEFTAQEAAANPPAPPAGAG